jgi:DNA-binding FadR family transcriptional regulator
MSYEKLVELIRRIAKEEAYEAIDEHLDEYEHKEKPLEDFETETGADKPNGKQGV